jgi:hypothetical protein
VWLNAASKADGNLARLESLPEASLDYPGSVRLRDGGHEDIPGGSSAETWRQNGTAASVDEVVAFYRQELTVRGWLEGGGPGVIGTLHEAQVCVWHTPEVVLRLSFWRPEKFVERYPGDPTHRTVYEVSLQFVQDADNPAACRYETP